jgi:membrane protease YdiL (CAAX protease family)
MDINALAVFFSQVGDCCLLLTGIFALAWFVLSGRRALLSTNILITLTAYVCCALLVVLWHPARLVEANTLNNIANMDFDLRATDAYSREYTDASFTKWFTSKTTGALKNTRLILDHANLENSNLAAYRIIVLHYLQEDCTKPLNILAHTDGENGAALAEDLKAALNITPISKQALKPLINDLSSNEQSSRIANDLKMRLPPTWFRNYALERLYQNTKQVDQLNSLKVDKHRQDEVLLQRLKVMTILSLIGFFSGALVLLVLLIQLVRKKLKPWSSPILPDANNAICRLYSFKSVYGTVIAFLATKLAFRHYFGFDRYYNPHITQSNALETTLSIAGIYAICNGCALLYAYIFALRPNKISFLEGICFRVHSGTTGPIRMLLIGALTCLPMMTIATLSGGLSKLCGLEGTSNPIYGIEVQVAHTGDLNSIIIMYMQFLLLVPFIEEALIRGFLYSALRQRMNVLYSVLVSSIIFSALHLDISGFLTIFTIGAILALVVERTKSIVPTIFAHGLWLCFLFTSTLLVFS